MGGCHQCPLASLYLLIILFLRHGGWSVVRSQVLTSRGLSLPGPWFQIGETLFKSRAETIQLILVYQLLWEAKWMVLSFNIHFSCCSQQTLHFWVQRSSPFPFLFHTTSFWELIGSGKIILSIFIVEPGMLEISRPRGVEFSKGHTLFLCL